MFMAQESRLTDSLKGIVCSETMTVCIYSRTCLTARDVLGAEGGEAVSSLMWLKSQLSSFLFTADMGYIVSLSEREFGSKLPPPSSHGHSLMTC